MSRMKSPEVPSVRHAEPVCIDMDLSPGAPARTEEDLTIVLEVCINSSSEGFIDDETVLRGEPVAELVADLCDLHRQFESFALRLRGDPGHRASSFHLQELTIEFGLRSGVVPGDQCPGRCGSWCPPRQVSTPASPESEE